MFVRRFDATGAALTGEILANTTTLNTQANAAIAMDDSGNFTVVWRDQTQDGSSWGIYAQRFDTNGATLGGEFQVNTTTADTQWLPAIAMNASGEFVISWASMSQDGDNAGAYARRYDATGVPTSGEFQLNTTTADSQDVSGVALDGSGNLVAVWRSMNQDGSSAGIYLQRYDATGASIGTETLVNSTTAGSQSWPAVSMNEDGRFVVTWEGSGVGDNSGVFVQRYEMIDLTFTAGDGVDDATFSMRGSLADLNVALEGLTYTPNASYVGADILTITTDDLGNTGAPGALQDIDNVAITVYDPAPQLDLDADDSAAAGIDFVATWTEGAGPVGVTDADATLTDFDSANLTSLTVTLTNPLDGFAEVLAADTSGTAIVASYDGATGILTLSGVDSVANYQQVLRTVTYHNVSEVTDDTTRVITFVASDGSNSSAVATTTLTIDATNDQPFSTVPGAQSTAIDTDIVFDSATGTLITVGDSDAGAATIEVDLSVTNGTLSLNLDGFAGIETRNNTTTFAAQYNSSIAMAPDGRYVVVWQDLSGADGDGAGVFGQLYDASGAPVGAEFGISTTTANLQISPRVAMDAAGNFVVTWGDSAADGAQWGIMAQRFDASGAKVGPEVVVNATTTGQQNDPEVAMTPTGEYVVAWSGNGPGDTTGIFFQRFDAAGNALGSETIANTRLADTQQKVDVAIDAAGNFLLAWQSPDLSSTGVFARVFDASGTPVTAEFRVNTTESNLQTEPSVAADATGNFVVAWNGEGPGDTAGVFFQRYDPTGVAQGAETRVNDTTASFQSRPDVAFDVAGDFMVVWQGQDQDGDGWGAFGRRYDGAGTPTSGEIQLSMTSAGHQTEVRVAGGATGAYVTTWSGEGAGDDSGVFSQRLEAPPTGLSFVVGDGTDDAAMTVQGTLENLNQAIAGLTYTPNASYVGADLLTITTDDLGNTGPPGPLQDIANVAITVFDPAPQLDLDADDSAAAGVDFAATWTEGAGPVGVADADATLADFDSASLSSLTVTITNPLDGAAEGLSADTTGTLIASSYDSATGVLTLAGSDTVANYQQVLRTITYDSIATNPNETARTITFQASDGVNSSALATTTLTVVGVAAPGVTVTASVVQGIGEQTTVSQQRAEFGATYLSRAVAVDEAGNTVVVWVSDAGADGDGNTIMARRYDALGNTLGGEFVVNTTGAGSQTTANVAMDDAGNFVVVWSSFAQDGDNWGVYGQRFDSSGVAQGGEFLVNTTTSGSQQFSSVTMDSAGDFVVVWHGEGPGDTIGIFGQRYDAAGVAQGGEFRVNETTASDQRFTQVASDSVGNFVVTWSSRFQDGGGWGVYARRYDSSGVPLSGEQLVNTTTSGDQWISSVAMNDAGAFAVAWRSDLSNDLFMQLYAADGTAVGGEVLIPSTPGQGPNYPQLVMDDAGNVTAVWEAGADSDDFAIVARRFDSTGTALGAQFLVNTHEEFYQEYPAVAMTGDGQFVVVFTDYNRYGDGEETVEMRRFATTTTEAGGTASFDFVLDTQPTDDVTITLSMPDGTEGTLSTTSLTFTNADWNIAQTVTVTGVDDAIADGDVTHLLVTASATSLDPDYAGLDILDLRVTNLDDDTAGITITRDPAAVGVIGNEFLVNTTTLNDQDLPAVGVAPDASSVVVWTSAVQDGSGDGIYGQRYDANGGPLGGEFLVHVTTASNQSEPSLSVADDGTFVVTWTSLDQDGDSNGIYARRFAADGTALTGEILVNQTTAGGQFRSSVSSDAAGNFVVA